MKVAGVIGGIGAKSTADFYKEVFFLCQKKNRIQRPPILIWSVPGLFETEKICAKGDDGLDAYLPFIIDGAKQLERGGADFLVFPCNSLHVFFDDIKKAVKIPAFSIVDETANFLEKKKIKKVGILSTPTTLKRKLYEQAFADRGISFTVPDNRQQLEIVKVIRKILQSKETEKEREVLNALMGDMKNARTNDVVLACTDLQQLNPSYSGIRVHDTMKILAAATAREILKI